MKIGVIQHRLRATPAEDSAALIAAARAAAAAGAQVVFMPEVFSLSAAGDEREALYTALDDVGGKRLVPNVGPGVRGLAFSTEPLPGGEPLGRLGVFVGDACMDIAEIERVARDVPDVVVLSPRSENDLQAEAMLEFAIGLSESLAGLVVIAETSGAEPGDAGHGGSAIVLLGDVTAEALADDDVLIAEIPEPTPAPEPREPLPQVPTILQQRLANHEGRKPEVGYLADLS